eukprot:6188562-Pleurochrysis_carterae.AAC.1
MLGVEDSRPRARRSQTARRQKQALDRLALRSARDRVFWARARTRQAATTARAMTESERRLVGR